jgi:Tfp pilus assembly protein PilF
MSARYLALAAALFAARPAVAEEHWSRLASKHFELYTSGNQKNGQETLRRFERIRGFFATHTGLQDDGLTPVRIVAFTSPGQYRPYRPSDAAAAYYVGDEIHDYIVLGDIQGRDDPVAVHEYTHLVAQRAHLGLPPWLNEGLAELYSTIKPAGGRVQVGEPIAHHLRLLFEARTLDLPTLFAVDDKSPYYRERERSGVFYAQSWALTHMLYLTPEYGPHTPSFIEHIHSGEPAAEALRAAYGKSVEEVEQDLARHIRLRRFYAAVFDVAAEPSAEAPLVRPAETLEVQLVLAELLGFVQHTDEARAKYASLAAAYPKSADVEGAFGFLEQHADKPAEAARHFARAVELGGSDPRMYFWYSVLLERQGSGPAETVPLLRKAVALTAADYPEAELRLGLGLLAEGNFGDAREHLWKVKTVAPSNRFTLQYALAHASAGLGDDDEAQRAADRARPLAQTPHEVTQLDDLQRYIDARRESRRLAALATSAPSAAPAASAKGPVPGGTARPLRRPLSSSAKNVDGTLDAVDCLGRSLRLRLTVAGKPVAVLIKDPQLVAVENAKGYVDLSCSPQPRRPRVRVFYTPATDATLGTIGTADVLRFE